MYIDTTEGKVVRTMITIRGKFICVPNVIGKIWLRLKNM